MWYNRYKFDQQNAHTWCSYLQNIVRILLLQFLTTKLQWNKLQNYKFLFIDMLDVQLQWVKWFEINILRFVPTEITRCIILTFYNVRVSTISGSFSGHSSNFWHFIKGCTKVKAEVLRLRRSACIHIKCIVTYFRRYRFFFYSDF
jgi:hypothetical protein